MFISETDGSRLHNSYSGCSVVWRDNDLQWQKLRYHLGNRKEIFDAELYAIAEAFKIAHRRNIRNPANVETVSVFTGSASALRRIQDPRPGPGQWIVNRIAEYEERIIDLGHQVEYHWVPGHADIEGNEVADVTAKAAATTPIQRQTRRLQAGENSTSLPHLHRHNTERKAKDTKEWLTLTLDNRPGYTLPRHQHPDKTVMKATKRLATRYHQLKIGHAVIGVHLKRIKTIDDDRCWWCESGERQSVEHLMKECRKWREARETLRKNVKRHLWQHHDLQHLFANRDASKPLLSYLEATEIGNKTAKKDVERAEEERDEKWGWNVLEEEPQAR